MLELLAGSRFIESQLKGRTVGNRVYKDFAPQKSDQSEDPAVFPCVIYSYAGGSDMPAVGEPVAYTDALFLVKVALRKSSAGQAQSILTDIDNQLRNAEGQQDGFRIRSARTRSIMAAELVNGVRYDYPGAYYRLHIEPIGS